MPPASWFTGAPPTQRRRNGYSKLRFIDQVTDLERITLNHSVSQSMLIGPNDRGDATAKLVRV